MHIACFENTMLKCTCYQTHQITRIAILLSQLALYVYYRLLLNILQDSSFSNQITFIFHIQGVFNLPGRGFRQRITLTSSVPMTLNDVIVHVRQFVIALVSVDGMCHMMLCRCSRRPRSKKRAKSSQKD